MHQKVRWKTFIVAVFLLLLSSLFVSATSTVAVTPVDNEITLAEEASFKISITNNGNVARTYTLYGLEVVWSVAPEARQFTLRPGQSRPVIVRIRPLGPFKPSTYGIKLFVDESTGSGSVPRYRFEEEMSIILYPDEPQEYLPAVIMTADIPAEINPQQPVPLSVHLVNGVFGTLAVGLFAQDKITGTATGNGLFFGGGVKLLLAQTAGVVAVGVFTFIVAFAVWYAIRAVLGLRVSREEELAGLDIGEHGMKAYPDFQGFLTK